VSMTGIAAPAADATCILYPFCSKPPHPVAAYPDIKTRAPK